MDSISSGLQESDISIRILSEIKIRMQILPERYAYSEISGTSILI